MANVVRKDVVEIEFKSDLSTLTKVNSSLDELKKSINGGVNDGLDDLKDTADKAQKAVKGLGDEKDGIDDLKKEFDKAKESVDGLNDKGKSAKNILDRLKNISMTKLKSGLKSVSSRLSTIAKKAGSAALSGLKKLASVSFKSLAAGIGAAATAVGGLVKSSVTAYADYEQQLGGVKTILGAKETDSVQEYADLVGKSVKEVKSEYNSLKEAENMVIENANNAYKRAGMSANEYMENTTSFAASLLQSVGNNSKKAAKLADTALVDISDNANKMGTDSEYLVQTYQSLARGQYTMLDNLKLGYGGTKTEAERLIKDAAKLDKSVDANDTSFGNLVKAIHAVQENMGITGTTAKEADKTISGSLSSLKAAWSNLMPALIQGGDSFDQCLANLIESATTFGKNIMPAIESALEGVGTLFEKVAPLIEKYLPKITKKLLPSLLKAATSMLTGVIKALPGIIGAFVAELPNIVKQIGKAIVEAFGNVPILGQIGDVMVNGAKGLANTLKVVAPIIIGAIGVTKIVKSLKPLTSLLGKSSGGTKGVEKSGGIFSSITGAFKELAKAKPATIAKGIANLAIIVGGLTAMVATIAIVAPMIAQMGDVKSFVEIVVAIGIVGTVGIALTKMTKLIKNVEPSETAKSLSNIAIIIGGLAALFVVIIGVSKLNFDTRQIGETVVLIGLVGIVGGACAALAGAVGNIPGSVGAVAQGLASIAVIIGGISVIIIAFGALSKIPGFKDFLKEGGDTLALLFKQIGKIIGSAISGFGQGITSCLPAIGENLSNFAKSIKPMFTLFKGCDMSGIGSFFGAIGGFLVEIAVNKVLSFFTGGTNLVGLGTQLTLFMASANGFFLAVANLPKGALANSSKLFEALSKMSGMPKSGGIVSWFTGNTDYSKIADGLKALSDDEVINFFNKMAEIDKKGFTHTKKMFKALSEIGGLPNTGGIAQCFTGETNLAKLGNKLPKLGEGIKKFYKKTAKVEKPNRISKIFKALSDIGSLPNTGGVAQFFSGSADLTSVAESLPEVGKGIKKFYNKTSEVEDPSRISKIFKALSSIGDLPNSGGFAQFFTGSADLGALGEGLQSFGEAIGGEGGFVEQVNKIKLKKLKGLWDSLSSVGEVTSTALDNVKENLNKIVSKMKNLPKRMGDAITDNASYLVDAMKAVWKKAANSSVDGANKVVKSTNNVLKQIGADKRLSIIPTYANGTSGHIGGSAIVNDGRGAELVQMPNGDTFIPKGKNVFMPNAPVGMKVLSAEETAKVMGKNSPTFHYKKGTKKKKEKKSQNVESLIKKIKKLIKYDNLKGLPKETQRGTAKTIIENLAPFLKSFSNGGIATKPSIFGESGKEVAIPLTKEKRKRGVSLWQQAGEMLGVNLPAYSPESGTTNTNVNNVEYNTYSPQFTLNIEGSSDEKTLSRKIKRWVNEAIEETLESIGRTNDIDLQEV